MVGPSGNFLAILAYRSVVERDCTTTIRRRDVGAEGVPLPSLERVRIAPPHLQVGSDFFIKKEHF